MKKKVFVGMSGGVDSSVSAALLKKAGYDVTGVFIKVWEPDWMECTSKQDRLDALRVAAVLDIPFLTLDLEKEYKKEVVDYMIDEYKGGRTPNPDVMCNKHVKFGAFFDWAMKQGADFVATGHYAQIDRSKDLVKLQKGDDPAKDQSYFLWTLTQKQLQKTLFPVGNIEKPEVRKLAKKFNLPTAKKKDSQGLCFIGKVDIKEFLSHFVESRRGNVLNEKGEVIGSHDGALFLTIGQRHGFTVTSKTPHDNPFFIIAKDIKNNTITVSQTAPQQSLDGENILLTSTNWIYETPISGKTYTARARYRQELAECTIEKDSNNTSHWKVTTTKPLGATSGQSLVVYDGNYCIGGGIIV